MNLDHLERAARAAGFAVVVDEDDATVGFDRDFKAPAALRFKTPDAPAPRSPATALALPKLQSNARASVTSSVGQLLRLAQGLIGTRSAHA